MPPKRRTHCADCYVKLTWSDMPDVCYACEQDRLAKLLGDRRVEKLRVRMSSVQIKATWDYMVRKD